MQSRKQLILGLVLAALCLGPSTPADTVEVGSPAPGFDVEVLLQAPKSHLASLDELRGEVVVVEYWATWCLPCVAAIPHLNQLADELADEPVRFISVTDEPREVVDPFLAEKPIAGWIGLDLDRSTFDSFWVGSLPKTFVIDSEGHVVETTMPELVTAGRLRQLLHTS